MSRWTNGSALPLSPEAMSRNANGNWCPRGVFTDASRFEDTTSSALVLAATNV
jgi:hypothetical protein